MNNARSLQFWLPIAFGSITGLLSIGCGDGEGVTLPPDVGRIALTVSTDGGDPDPDGYVLLLDGADQEAIAANGSTVLESVAAGMHSVGLSGIAANCSLEGDNPRSIVVEAGGIASVTFSVTCDPPPPASGALRITVATSGTPAPESYSIAVDGQTPQPVGVNAVLELTGLAAGDHTVALSGLTANCVVAEANPRAVTVPGGGTAELAFTVACATETGSLLVTTSTGGAPLDPDGYAVRLDGGSEQAIGINASLTIPVVAAGDHSVELSGVAENCQVADGNVRSVTVAAGTQATVAFGLTCSALGVQRWTAMQSRTGADLPDIWGTSATDIFTVGEVVTDDGGFELASVILHYDGNQWSPQYRQEDLSLRGVWASSATDAFAVGGLFLDGDAAILHYDGQSWSPMAVPPNPGQERFLESVWGSSAGDVFAVGSSFDGAFFNPLILHYDLTRWTVMRVPPSLTPSLSDVWGSGPDDVYAVGDSEDDDGSVIGTILHFDGVRWSRAFAEQDLSLKAVWGSSRTDVFAVGFGGVILHYDGTRWSRMTSPTSNILFEIWGSSASDVFAVGDDGIILHYDGSTWSGTTPTTRSLLGVWGSSPSDVFAVGNRGTILHGTP